MAVQPWRAALLVAGGVVVGVAIAGLPTRSEDPPLQVRADVTTTTTDFTAITVAETTSSTSSTSTTAAVTSTTRRRP